MEKGLKKTAFIAQLTKSTHGDLKAYLPIGNQLFEAEPEFGSHLIAYNEKNGQVRDSRVALPVVALNALKGHGGAFYDNALAHLALLDPRNLMKALAFAREVGNSTWGHGKFGVPLRRLVKTYLRAREENWAWWERTTVQHRASMKSLYAYGHVKPNAMADMILFKGNYPKGTVFHGIANLKNMDNTEAAGFVMEKKIPFLVAVGALGAKLKDPDLVLAMMSRMTPTELVTNTNMLVKLGVRTVPALRAAFEEGLAKAAESKKVTFKTTRAAEAIGDEVLKAKLGAVQEKQIKTLAGADGDWLVLADKSGSMEKAIETARLVASTLAKAVKGEVHLIFFDTSPRYIEATGKTYEQILALTKNIEATGGTSIGCGLQYALEKGLDFDGIAIVSDAGENNAPFFPQVYKRMVDQNESEPPVYLYLTKPDKAARAQLRAMYGSGFLDRDTLSPAMESYGYAMQTFDLETVDFYSLPNIIQTMNVKRYSLADTIMETPFLTLDDVFKKSAQLATA